LAEPLRFHRTPQSTWMVGPRWVRCLCHARIGPIVMLLARIPSGGAAVIRSPYHRVRQHRSPKGDRLSVRPHFPGGDAKSCCWKNPDTARITVRMDDRAAVFATVHRCTGPADNVAGQRVGIRRPLLISAPPAFPHARERHAARLRVPATVARPHALRDAQPGARRLDAGR